MANKFLTNINLIAGLEADGQSGTSGQILSSTGTGVQWINASTGSISGSGTANNMTKWTGTGSIGNALMTDDGSTISLSTNGGSNTFDLSHTSGSGIALNITKGGNNEALVINKTSGNGNAVSITGDSYFNGNVGIGTTSPTSTLQVDGQVLISATAPLLDFVDTNSFSDVNDRFRVRAGSDEGLIQWYDDSSSSLLSIMTFQPNGNVIVPNGNLSVSGTITASNFSGTSSGTNTGDQDLSGYLLTTGKAADSELLDGIDSSRIIFGNNSSGTNERNVTDWNAPTKTGFYSDDTAANRWASATDWSSILHFKLYDDNNNYASQLGFNTYDDGLYTRTNSGGTWTSWKEIWHSGNDGSGSGLDADLLDGQHASAFQPAGTYNTIIGTDSDINTSGSTIIDNIYVTDGVITSHGTRTLTLGDLGYTGATNANYITNNNQLTNGAGYITSYVNTTYNFSGSNFTSRNSGNPIAVDSATSNTVGYTTSSSAAGYSDGGLFVAAYNSSWVSQIFSNFRTGEISVRGKNNGTWQPWRFVYDSGNLSLSTLGYTGATNANYITNNNQLTNGAGYITSSGTVTSLIGLGIIQSTSTGTSYQNNYQIRENSGGGGNTSETYAPQIAFHHSGVVASSIMMEASGRIAIRNNPGTGYENFIASTSYATSSVQAPIFYDLNNTGYYVNPASTSRFNEIQTSDSGATPRYDTAFYVIQGQHWYGDTGSQVMYLGESSNPVRLRGNLRIGGDANADGGMKLTVEGSSNATSSFRAPIFYDSNNTGYYLNPASTSNLSTVTAAQFNGPLSGNASTATTATNVGGLTPNMIVSGGSGRKSTQVSSFSGASETSGFYFGNNVTGAPTTDWLNYIQVAGNSWASGNNYSFQLTHAFHSDNFWVSRMTNGSQSAARLILDAGSTDQTKSGILQSNASLRAPIFYDSNNTGYYLNPASTSLLSQARFASRIYVGSNTNQINITYDQIYRPDGGQIHIGWSAANNIQFNNGGGYTYSLTSLRAPVFYDYNNTSYFVNPAFGSVMNSIVLSGNNAPIISKYPGYKSWVQHTTGNAFIFAPSTAVNGTSWDWSSQIRLNDNGTIQPNGGYKSSDGTNGLTTMFTFVDDYSDTRTLQFKNGLLVSAT